MTNSFTAEYGGSTGSAVNMVTKSGGSEFHGEALYMGRPSATEAALDGFTAANATSGNDLTNDTLNQVATGAFRPAGRAATDALSRRRRIQPWKTARRR